jgi:single-strand DNA-binding protein
MTTANDLIFAILRSAHFTIQGRVGQDPELKYFQSGTCKVQLSLGVNRLGAKRDDPNAPPPDWFKAEFWGTDAEDVTNVIRKGDLLQVTGRIKTETWTDRNGKERTDVLVRVERWQQIVNGQPVARAPMAAEPAQGQGGGFQPVAAAQGGGLDLDDEVPF